MLFISGPSRRQQYVNFLILLLTRLFNVFHNASHNALGFPSWSCFSLCLSKLLDNFIFRLSWRIFEGLFLVSWIPFVNCIGSSIVCKPFYIFVLTELLPLVSCKHVLAQSAGVVEYTYCISAEGPDYDTKQSDGEATVILELLGNVPLLPGQLWPRMIAPDRVR